MKLTKALYLSIFLFSSSSQAGYIVDTGSNASGTPWSFSSDQYFAGEFSISSTQSISSVEGFFLDFFGGRSGQITIAINSDAGNVPGAPLFSTSITLDAPIATDWHGAFNLNWTLPAGTYWASFIPTSGLDIAMPGDAPNPLAEYAQGSSGNWTDAGPDYFDYLNVGIRISADSSAAVPEPATLALMGLGLAGIASRRKKAA